MFVTFKTSDPIKLPLPSPTYLKIHAACARVANLSGAGEYLDRILWDLEYAEVLCDDGSSAELLEHALLTAVQRVRVF